MTVASLDVPAARDSRELPLSTIAAIVLFSAITPLVLLIAPALAVQLGLELKLSPAEIGNFFFVELGAMSLATLPSYWWLPRIEGRVVAAVAAAIFLAGNAATAILHPSYGGLLLLRAITAFGGGTLMVLCMTTAATARNRDRVYGLWVVGQLVAGAVGLVVLPHLFAVYGMRALYGLLTVAALICLPLIPCFLPRDVIRARQAAGSEHGAVAGEDSLPRALLCALAVFMFYIAIGGAWTFASSSAASMGFSPEASGTVLAIASAMGIVGALLASMLGGVMSRATMLWAGYGILIASLVLLCLDQGAWAYVAALLAFKFAWTFVIPFVLAAVAAIDRSRKLMASVNLMIGGGLAVGPLLAGVMVQALGRSTPMFAAAAVVAVGSLAALFVTAVRQPT